MTPVLYNLITCALGAVIIYLILGAIVTAVNILTYYRNQCIVSAMKTQQEKLLEETRAAQRSLHYYEQTGAVQDEERVPGDKPIIVKRNGTKKSN